MKLMIFPLYYDGRDQPISEGRAATHVFSLCILSVAEMRMLRWICGHTRMDLVRNDDIRDLLGVALIEEKLVQHRLT